MKESYDYQYCVYTFLLKLKFMKGNISGHILIRIHKNQSIFNNAPQELSIHLDRRLNLRRPFQPRHSPAPTQQDLREPH